MAQLSDDCFAFGGALLPIEEAMRIIAANIGPVASTETVTLADADGRVLAGDIVAPIDLPPYANSAVDGYAVRSADLRDRTVLPVEGRAAAGDPAGVALRAGTARRIFTGAILPEGADTVFMQEDVRLDEAGRVHLPPGLRRGANTRAQGEDVRAGATALPDGRRLRPQDVALAASLGLRDLTARRPIRLALFSTGDEVVDPGTPLAPGKLYDANRILLAALARRAGAEVTDFGILPDSAGVITGALRDATRTHDLVMTSGGVSAGDEDHVRRAIEATGHLVFWRLAIKPGRPVAMGVIDGTPLVGLPGNPVAAFVTFAAVARPLIAALSGAAPPERIALPVRAGFSHRKKSGRREYLRVRLIRAADGELEARKHPRDGAGILSSLTETDGLAELAEPVTTVVPGDVVGYLPYADLF
ncbi:molybdopterin molybdotransferase MoeA [Acidiphilium iwatense]|uniref:Molybdopterin molybdenumtransferase n=1 Tax=Acidiphilium iwatense TaxID=768198 RepID=A0ABS9DWC4_9PROT|nr:gephyrin-like molybdotransferase Glp [Acidiphilium iwatense]MCF3946989.1 molybdopterin molybdotransferase MoeA [Acidiphilium iwatense]